LIYDGVTRLIESSVADTEKMARSVAREAESSLLAEMAKVKVLPDGRIDPKSRRNVKLATDSYLRAKEVIRKSGWLETESHVLRAVQDVRDETEKVWRDNYRAKPAYFTSSREAARLAASKVHAEFANIGEAGARVIQRELFNAVSAGSDFRTFQERLRTVLLGQPDLRDKAGQGMFRHAGTLARTSTTQLSRSIDGILAKKAGIKTFIYDGPIDPSTRDFCRAHVGQVLTREEIDGLSNGQTGSTFISGGGWRCRHRWIPYVDRKSLRKKLPKPVVVSRKAEREIGSDEGPYKFPKNPGLEAPLPKGMPAIREERGFDHYRRAGKMHREALLLEVSGDNDIQRFRSFTEALRSRLKKARRISSSPGQTADLKRKGLFKIGKGSVAEEGWRRIERFYPRSFFKTRIRKLERLPIKRIQMHGDTKFSYFQMDQIVLGDVEHATHEYGHALQGTVLLHEDGLLQEWYHRKTVSEPVRALPGYRPSSGMVGKSDSMVDSYAGRQYKRGRYHGYLELMSVGFEALSEVTRGYRFFSKAAKTGDWEYLDFMIGVLFHG